MIEYYYETDFQLNSEKEYTGWLEDVISSENHTVSHINYVFCDDEYLYQMNVKHLKHNKLTDILTFDYSQGTEVSGDIFISVERVRDNSVDFKVDFEEELLRVMAHGVLHMMGLNDKTDDDKRRMQNKENEKIKMFHVEQ